MNREPFESDNAKELAAMDRVLAIQRAAHLNEP